MSLEFLSKKKSIGGCGEPWQPQHFCALCSLPLLRFPGSVCFATQLCLEPMFQKCYGLKVCKMLGKNNKRLWPWAFLGTKKNAGIHPEHRGAIIQVKAWMTWGSPIKKPPYKYMLYT